MTYTLSIIGCGTMGQAILSGILSQLDSSPADLPTRYILTVGRDSSIPALRDSFPAGKPITYLHGDEGNLQAIKESDIVLLACKPYMAQSILAAQGVKEALDGKVLASVLAGVTMEQLQTWAPGSHVVRTMTNTPSKIGHGMTLITPIPSTAPPSTTTRLQAIFRTCGLVRFLPEQKFNAATALAGSGPAFVAVMVDALADGGVLMGLTRQEATEMAAQTMSGTARMILDTPLHPSLLKDGVTTPGGCTIAGLMRMEDGNVRSTLARTVQAATLHAAGLGQEKK
ncbi:hypothetical protein NliqN6_1374 [Naganishia liquefaciens]|uniref:Pyrroline-5-carboxylate reductase n=1 Tax=Naganishia liquefaciens TaxID=104408 RepID=A0A8H3YE75_9TREE|nr:hypothetical protein NliqN6_1374 [Naganishia liquefaciens]